MTAKKKSSAVEPVATVAKALATLRSFVDGQDKWGVRELAVALDMPPSTVHRLLARLRMEGFVGYEKPHQKYTVGFEFARLSAAVMQRHGLRQAALALMRELTDRTGEGVWLALYDDEQHRIAYIAESESPHASRYIAPLGRIRAMTDSACGIALLASLQSEEREAALKASGASTSPSVAELIAEASEKGYAVMRATEVGSAMMVASAVRDESGRPLGSLGVVVPLHRMGTGQETMLGDLVRDTCERLSHRLGAKLLGGASAGTWQDAVGLISGLMRERNPSLAITPALGGGGRNLDDIDKGLGAYGLTVASSLFDAREGRGQFNYRHDSLRTVMHLSALHFLVIVRSDLNVEQFGDLAKLRVSPGEQGFSGAQAFEDALDAGQSGARKLSRKGSATLYLDYPEGKRQFEAGSVDVVAWMSSFSNPMIRELEMSTASMLVGLEPKVVEAMIQHNPGYRRGVVSKSAFPRWLQADLITVEVPTVLVCRVDRPEQEVYEFARTVYEHRASLGQLSSVYEGLDATTVLNGLTAPMHPGAERFFHEAGIRATYAAPGVEIAATGRKSAPTASN